VQWRAWPQSQVARVGRKRGVEATSQGVGDALDAEGKQRDYWEMSRGRLSLLRQVVRDGKAAVVAGTTIGVGEMAGVESTKEVVVAPPKGALFAKSRSTAG